MTENSNTDSKAQKNPCRPVVIVNQKQLTEYQECLHHLFAGLAEKSVKSALVCPADGDFDFVLSPSTELFHHPLLKRPFFSKQNRQSVLEKLTKFKPTVLHCFSSAKAGLTRSLAEELNIPFILTFSSSSHKKLKKTIKSPNCTTLLALSRDVANQLRQNHKYFQGTVKQLNTGTFVEDTCACFSDPNRVISMIIAEPLKNPDDLKAILNAVRHLAVDGYEFILAIIGKGPAERQLHKIIRHLSLSQIVTVVPEIHPLRSVFSEADIFIQPKTRPEFNSPLLEAMGAGMVVAASRKTCEDILIKDETAVFFDTSNELSAYSCLQKLIDNKPMARQIASTGQQYLRENYTVTKMVDSLLDSYKQARKLHEKKQQQNTE